MHTYAFCYLKSIFANERSKTRTEDEFLDVIGTKVLRVFLLAIHSNLY
jgi:hypothetical protein